MFLVAIWSLKQAKNKGEFWEIHGNANWSSNTWRIRALEHFIALFQANQRCKEGNQKKKSNNHQFRMAVRNFAHHAKPLEAAKDFAHHAKFRMVCEVFLCTNSVRFLSSDILCNFLVYPCNQPRYFLLYLFIYLLGSRYMRRELCVIWWWMFFIKHL